MTVKLAEAYGYCWGVERAVQMAYEARRAYPGQKLHITNEIIHNPSVNQVPSCTQKLQLQTPKAGGELNLTGSMMPETYSGWSLLTVGSYLAAPCAMHTEATGDGNPVHRGSRKRDRLQRNFSSAKGKFDWDCDRDLPHTSCTQRLLEMDIQIIEDPGSGKDFSTVAKGDVVILPAFGASVQEMQLLNAKEAIMVDTTCPWVSKASGDFQAWCHMIWRSSCKPLLNELEIAGL